MSWIFREPLEAAVYTRRVHAPQVARISFRRPTAAYGLDVLANEAWTGQRRAYAPVRVAVATTSWPFSPAGRVLASLLTANVFGEDIFPTEHSRRFQSGFAQIGSDVGQSASFTVSVTGLDSSATVMFTGAGDDPYGPIGLSTATGLALGADTLRELAVQNPAVFGGTSASRTV